MPAVAALVDTASAVVQVRLAATEGVSDTAVFAAEVTGTVAVAAEVTDIEAADTGPGDIEPIDTGPADIEPGEAADTEDAGTGAAL